MRGGLPTRFEPGSVEARWQAEWDRGAYFRAPSRPVPGPRFSLVLPPPNVTGFLTLGHMLGGTIMDTLVRWHRMRGEATLWLPGVDHAGLATQIEVRKHLARKGVALESLSREKAAHQVEAWKEEHETRIRSQWRAAGFSLDMSRYRYTLDSGFQRATRRAFVTLFNAGLIYRGERIVNWDPKMRTAISDLEVVHQEETGTLAYIRYPWADGSPGGLAVATVRPETIFGDVAVAVHPDDARHKSSAGRRVRVPLTDRDVPVITDRVIDPAFGNGALKVTPRHDALDFEVYRRHTDLPMPPSVLDPAGRLTSDWVPHRFQGLDRQAARLQVLAELRREGLVEKEEPFVHSVGRSERSEAVIEPYLSTQWFVKMGPLKEAAAEAVRRGEVRLHPERWHPAFFHWMETLEDWCISRQIVWGHPIPVYTCANGHVFAAEDTPQSCPTCRNRALSADPDVLDTWFSSWLWPFAVLGWPEETADLASYYPTDALVTGRDIMFFWVARMVMAGFRFRGQRPFSDVYFTGMLRDERGRRMSKHLGNSPDPIDVIRSRGADALRFALLYPNPTDQDGSFGAASLDGARNFLTKVWNLGRLVVAHTTSATEPPRTTPALDADAPLKDRWILSRWRRASEQVETALAEFDFTRVGQSIHDFLWHDLADWYVEMSKPSLAGRDGEPAARVSRAVLLYVYERALRRLHPIAPHVTEELWHAIPHEGESLTISPWPPPTETPSDPEAEVAMEVVIESVRALRTLRTDGGIGPQERPTSWVRPSSAEVRGLLERHAALVRTMAQLSELHLVDPDEGPPGSVVTSVTAHAEFFLPRSAESTAVLTTLKTERERLNELLTRTRKRLGNPAFASRAPPEVVREVREKAEELEERIRKIDEHVGEGPPETA